MKEEEAKRGYMKRVEGKMKKRMGEKGGQCKGGGRLARQKGS